MVLQPFAVDVAFNTGLKESFFGGFVMVFIITLDRDSAADDA